LTDLTRASFCGKTFLFTQHLTAAPLLTPRSTRKGANTSRNSCVRPSSSTCRYTNSINLSFAHTTRPTPSTPTPQPLHHGSSRRNPPRRKCPRHDWHHMLVCPAYAADLAELPHEEHRRLAPNYDVLMERIGRAIRRVCDRAEIQHTVDCTTAMLLCAVWGELGAVSDIWPVCRDDINGKTRNSCLR